MNDLFNKEKIIELFSQLDSVIYLNILKSVIIIFILWIIKKIFSRIIHRNVKNAKTTYQWNKTFSYIVALLGFLLIGRIWFKGAGSILTIIGLLSAGIAIALKDVFVNLAGFIFIMWRQPLEVGHRIQIGEVAGDVVDIRPFQFTILEIGNWVDADQSTGRMIHIPNGKIFTENLANYHFGFEYIWHEIPVLLTFESNWQKAREILDNLAMDYRKNIPAEVEKQIKAAARKYLIIYNKLTPIVYLDVKDCGVLLTIRYLVEPRQRRSVEEKFWEKILTEFGKNEDIDFAYPTTRIYSNYVEGKKGAINNNLNSEK
ncbi:MAG: mechanosensitive ion channel [Candidatus Marinimicrobia bacterium]|jgi:small-conductance mechanosensitive channel|nr:mechanosensitive ion channel [Candidatus Neomarinimicrobiota bacterium]